MNPLSAALLCLHCESAPQANRFRLCQRCGLSKGIRNLYKKRKGWTPEWDAHLQQLADRAKKRLPLFDVEQTQELPPRPYRKDRTNRNRRERPIIYHKVHLGEST